MHKKPRNLSQRDKYNGTQSFAHPPCRRDVVDSTDINLPKHPVGLPSHPKSIAHIHNPPGVVFV